MLWTVGVFIDAQRTLKVAFCSVQFAQVQPRTPHTSKGGGNLRVLWPYFLFRKGYGAFKQNLGVLKIAYPVEGDREIIHPEGWVHQPHVAHEGILQRAKKGCFGAFIVAQIVEYPTEIHEARRCFQVLDPERSFIYPCGAFKAYLSTFVFRASL